LNNDALQAELNQLRKEYSSLKLGDSDRSEVVKSKLTSILDRLEQLENLGQ